MSKPQYLRHDNSPMSIVVTCEDITKYLFAITSNSTQFPKQFRYNLVNDIKVTCLNLNKNIRRAVNIRPRFVKQAKQRAKYAHKAYEDIVDLKTLMSVAFEVANIKNKDYWARLLDDLIISYGKWVKNDKRNFKDLPTKKEFLAKQARLANQRRKKREMIEYALSTATRDENGFIRLTHKNISELPSEPEQSYRL